MLICILIRPSKPYNSPALRARLASALEYVANPCFLDFVKWKVPTGLGHSVLLDTRKINANDDDAPSLALLCIVGVVSTKKLQLDSLGTWSEKYNERITSAKLKFTLVKPTGHTDFENDFDHAIAHIWKLQDIVSIRGSDRSWFVLSNTSLRFNHNLFIERVSISRFYATFTTQSCFLISLNFPRKIAL